MTSEQQQWVATLKATTRQVPAPALKPPSRSPCRAVLFRIISSQLFDTAITCVIIGNIGVMACDSWSIKKNAIEYEVYVAAMDAFSFIYYGEALLKIGALGDRHDRPIASSPTTTTRHSELSPPEAPPSDPQFPPTDLRP